MVCCGLLLGAVGVARAAAQTSSNQPATTSPNVSTETRPGLPTFFGDTGLWFVPTAETLPAHKASFQLFRANWDEREGLTDVNNIGFTAAFGVIDRVELFGSWKVVRLRRGVRNPTFVPSDPAFGGIDYLYPYMRRGWAKTLGSTPVIGAKWSLISQSRGDAMSLAIRPVLEFPSGTQWGGTSDMAGHLDAVASREFAQKVELTGSLGGVIRSDPAPFDLSDGMVWGLGAIIGSRSRLRGLAEFTGGWAFNENVYQFTPPYIGDDGSIAPLSSPLRDPSHFKFGGVFQAHNGAFVYLGANYSNNTGSHTVAGLEMTNNPWGFDIRVGWHPGIKVYVPPPPPAPEIREVIREVPAAPGPGAEPPARLQRSDPGEPARARTGADDEPERARDGSGRRHDHVYVELAGWHVQQSERDEHDGDRAEPGRQLPADRHGERRTRRHGDQLHHQPGDPAAADHVRGRALRLRQIEPD